MKFIGTSETPRSLGLDYKALGRLRLEAGGKKMLDIMSIFIIHTVLTV